MSLTVREFPLMRRDFNFFESYMNQFARELEQQMHADIERARSLMFNLLPANPVDVMSLDVKPSVPIVEERGETKLKLEFNVKQFKPEELEVKLLGGNLLQVSANHEEKSESGVKKMSYLRQYSVPKGVDIEHIKPVLSRDGVLTVEAPALALKPNERMIPIEYNADK